MRGAAAEVVSVTSFAVVNVEAGGYHGVFEQALEERDFEIAFTHQDVSELMGQSEGALGTQGIDKEGVRSIKGVDVALAAGDPCPARGLHCAGDFEGEFVGREFFLVVGNPA